MKHSFWTALLIAQTTAWAQENLPADTVVLAPGSQVANLSLDRPTPERKIDLFKGISPYRPSNEEIDKYLANPQELLDRPDVRPYAEQVKTTLNIGSDAELVGMAKKISPEIIKKVASLDIKLTPDQIKKLEELAVNRKATLVASLVTGKIPNGLISDVEKIIPELKKLDVNEKEEVFNAVSSTANKMVFDAMVKAEAQLGYLAGSASSGMVTQLNAKLLNIRKITLGGIEIENVHAKVEVGYPKNGILLLSGSVKLKEGPFRYEGDLLGLSHDIRKHALEVKIAEGRVVYNILPWLDAYGGLGLGVRSYTDGTFFSSDPKIGARAKTSVGRFNVEGYAEGTLRVAEMNPVLICGARAGTEILNNDFVKMNAGILSQFGLEGNPREHGNGAEWFNGAGISGHF